MVSALTADAELGSLNTIEDIVACCVRLGASEFGGPLSVSERQQIAWSAGIAPDATLSDTVRRGIREGRDPLGEALTGLRSPLAKRLQGAIYTPLPIVRSMVSWILVRDLTTLIDPGCGTGRYAAEAARQQPSLRILAVDSDPVGTLITRAVLACLGQKNCTVANDDYLTWEMPANTGRHGFVGNPPYVRHHDIGPEAKGWGRAAAARLGVPWSGLAGLHILFALATALRMRDGDAMCFITSAEWLDVRYGMVLRALLTNQPRLQTVHILDPRATAFSNAMTTATIFSALHGAENTEIAARVIDEAAAFAELGDHDRFVPLEDLAASGRWTTVVRDGRAAESADGLVPLGSFVRVSRGVATGANDYFVMPHREAEARGLRSFVRPALTSAEEIFNANGNYRVTDSTKYVLDVPLKLGVEARAQPTLGKYLLEGEERGVAARYLSKQRRHWWVLSPDTPPIVATYMARRPPAFALNPDGAAILNVCHGLYPRVPLTDEQLRGLVVYLNSLGDKIANAGRTYHGGLHKFEPREMESIPVPRPDVLSDYAVEKV